MEFDQSDIDPRFSVKRNDKVEFSIVEDSRTRTKRAHNIHPLKETGILTSIKDGVGNITPDDKSIEDEIIFHTSEMEQPNQLQQGSILEFFAILNNRTKTMNAYDVKLVSPGKKRTIRSAIPTPTPTGGTVGGKSGVVVLRQPLPGDGTRGFTAVGRGKLLPDDRDRMVQTFFQPQTTNSNNSNNNNNGYGILSGLNHYASLEQEILEQ